MDGLSYSEQIHSFGQLKKGGHLLLAGFPKDSLWYNRDIIERVQVEWGRHSLVTATRNMMKLALQEPLNKKLILLSEAGIPLYPPTALYHQLMLEEKSRINSCTLPGVSTHSNSYSGQLNMSEKCGLLMQIPAVFH